MLVLKVRHIAAIKSQEGLFCCDPGCPLKMSEFLEAEQCGSVFEPEGTKRGNERETFLQPGPNTYMCV